MRYLYEWIHYCSCCCHSIHGIYAFIGWYSKHMISGNADFMVAGRRLGPILMAGTLAATEIGGGSSLGVVQQGMGKYGISAAWYVIAMGFAFLSF